MSEPVTPTEILLGRVADSLDAIGARLERAFPDPPPERERKGKRVTKVDGK